MNFGFSNICLLPGGRSFNYYLHLCVKKEVFRSHSWNNNALLILYAVYSVWLFSSSLPPEEFNPRYYHYIVPCSAWLVCVCSIPLLHHSISLPSLPRSNGSVCSSVLLLTVFIYLGQNLTNDPFIYQLDARKKRWNDGLYCYYCINLPKSQILHSLNSLFYTVWLRPDTIRW